MRLKFIALLGFGALLAAMTACGDPNRSSYVRYTPAPASTTAPAATST